MPLTGAPAQRWLTLVLACGLTLPACATSSVKKPEPTPASRVACDVSSAPSLGAGFKLRVGGVASIAGEKLRVEFQELLSDSRCPVGVVCVWAGEAKIRVRIERPPDAPAELDLSTRVPAKYLSYELQLVNVAPAPVAGNEADPSEYCAEIRIARPE